MDPPQPSSPLLVDAVRGGPPAPGSDVELAAAFGFRNGRAHRARSPLQRAGRDRDALVVHNRDLEQVDCISPGACYLLYCVTCLALTAALLAVAVWESFAPSREARFWRRRLRPWEEGAESFVGAALCTETLTVYWVLGWRRFFRDRWRILDAVVAGLTMLCGVFFLCRRVLHHVGDVVEDIDVPVLALRFSLQPVRMFSAAGMVVRAHRLHQVGHQPPPPPPTPEDPRRPCPALSEPALTVDLAVRLRELLPCYLRYVDWELGYSPRVHGTSLNTFYRRQAGPNILVLRDAHGGTFGGFATEPWRPTNGAYGSGEAFVFVAREQLPQEAPESGLADGRDGGVAPEEAAPPAPPSNGDAPGNGAARLRTLPREVRALELQPMAPQAPPPAPELRLEVFWAVPKRGRVIQWSDSKMLGLGHAVVVCDDFLRGSSADCEAFGSAPLSPAGKEFIIRDFECWHVGPGQGETWCDI